jgi:hypothetical protein
MDPSETWRCRYWEEAYTLLVALRDLAMCGRMSGARSCGLGVSGEQILGAYIGQEAEPEAFKFGVLSGNATEYCLIVGEGKVTACSLGQLCCNCYF